MPATIRTKGITYSKNIFKFKLKQDHVVVTWLGDKREHDFQIRVATEIILPLAWLVGGGGGGGSNLAQSLQYAAFSQEVICSIWLSIPCIIKE